MIYRSIYNIYHINRTILYCMIQFISFNMILCHGIILYIVLCHDTIYQTVQYNIVQLTTLFLSLLMMTINRKNYWKFDRDLRSFIILLCTFLLICEVHVYLYERVWERERLSKYVRAYIYMIVFIYMIVYPIVIWPYDLSHTPNFSYHLPVTEGINLFRSINTCYR